MIHKTKDLSIFKFRDDNREKIRPADVEILIEKIKKRNMLDINPIHVSPKMEVIQGQHRVLAARKLGLEIYYMIVEDFKPQDIIAMNAQKSWTTGDFLNFYCKNGYEHYIALKKFIEKHNLGLRTGILLTAGESKVAQQKFRDGEYIFVEETTDDQLLLCWETIDIIKKFNGYSVWTVNARFWRAMLKLFRSPNFDSTKWLNNVSKLVARMGPRTKAVEYCEMIENVYNYHNKDKIFLNGKEE